MEQEAGSPVVEPVEPLVPSSNGWHVQDQAVLETTIDAEETHVLIGSEDFEAKINNTLKGPGIFTTSSGSPEAERPLPVGIRPERIDN